MKTQFSLLAVATLLSFAASAGAGKAGDGGHLISCDAPYYWNGDLLDSFEGWKITGSASFDTSATKTPDTTTRLEVREIDEARRRWTRARQPFLFSCENVFCNTVVCEGRD